MRPVRAPLLLVAILGGCAAGAGGAPNPFDRLTAADRAMAQSVRQQALETGVRGEVFEWSGAQPETGGSVKVLATLRRDDGTYCRRFVETVYAQDVSDSFEATFCRNDAGEWAP